LDLHTNFTRDVPLGKEINNNFEIHLDLDLVIFWRNFYHCGRGEIKHFCWWLNKLSTNSYEIEGWNFSLSTNRSILGLIWITILVR